MMALENLKEIESVQNFHQHLEDLSSAGIKFDLGFSASRRNAFSIPLLQQQFSAWGRQHPDSTPAQVIRSYLATAALPSAYKHALELWVQGDRPTALDVLALPVSGQRLMQRSYLFVAMQTIFLLTAVFVSLVGVCIFLVPIFTGLQEQSFRPAGFGLQNLQWLHAWLPVWGTLVPILLASLLLFQRSIFRSTRYWTRPSTDVSFVFAELRNSLNEPVRLPIAANIAILLCALGVIVVVYGIYGTTIELLINILNVQTERS
jgi:hypothetical protein